MAELLNSDKKLHLALSPNSPHTKITGKEYYDGCKAWETRKNGINFVILCDEKPIGSISYHKKNSSMAGCGYWIESDLTSFHQLVSVKKSLSEPISEYGCTNIRVVISF